MIAIRENERRARFLGIPVERHIWISFSISCFFTALAGSLYALLNNFADPLGLHYTLSGEIVIMAVMGGMRSFWGPLLGAAVFVVLQDYISSHDDELDVLRRPAVRAGGAVLPARTARHAAARRARAMSHARRSHASPRTSAAWSRCDDVSLSVAPGELRAIIGPNGAGKTTFFNLISGFFPPTAGTILLDGRDVTRLSGA